MIGAGPAGSRVACRLAQEGFRVAVIERKRSLNEPVCCTGIVGWECVRSFNIEDRFILRKANSARLFSPSGRILAVSRPDPQAAVLNRPAFNAALGEAAQQSGADYFLGTNALSLESEPDAIRIAAAYKGEAVDIRARAAVLACNLSPALTGEMGRIGDVAAGVQAAVETNNSEVEVYFGEKFAPGFFAWLVPTTPGAGLAGLISRRTPLTNLAKFLEYLAAAGKIASAEVKIYPGFIPLQAPGRTYAERMLLVGNAAGHVKPTTGGGVYYGLIGADIAADVLAQALREDDLSGRRLATYQRLWKRRLGHELKVGYWARRLFERLDDSRLDRLFEIMESSGMAQELIKGEELSFDWQSRMIMKVVGNAAMVALLGVIKRPFR